MFQHTAGKASMFSLVPSESRSQGDARRFAARWRERLICAALASLVCAPAAAQSPAPAQPPAQAGQGQTLRLTREDAVRLAAENNPDLAVARFDPLVSDTEVAAARAAFLPTATSSLL